MKSTNDNTSINRHLIPDVAIPVGQSRISSGQSDQVNRCKVCHMMNSNPVTQERYSMTT